MVVSRNFGPLKIAIVDRKFYFLKFCTIRRSDFIEKDSGVPQSTLAFGHHCRPSVLWPLAIPILQCAALLAAGIYDCPTESFSIETHPPSLIVGPPWL